MGKRMASESDAHNAAALEFLSADVIPANYHQVGDQSNAILLLGKRKSKPKANGNNNNNNKSLGPKKRDRKRKGKLPAPMPTMSKSKLRKLKRLQEENEKKLIQSESIKTLQQCRISDGAYHLIRSSGTIGQTETAREKRMRAVQLSKAGLEVPKDAPPSKKKREVGDAAEDEVSSMLDSDWSRQEQVSGGRDDGNLDGSVESHLKLGSDGLMDVEGVPMAEAEEKNTATCMVDDEKKYMFISYSPGKGEDTSYKDQELDGSNISCRNMRAPAEFLVHEQVSGPIVVHVSRPKEVEEKRRDLPIIMMEQEIMEAINEHSTVILCGETGCGKTTQVPQFLYEAGFGSRSSSHRKGIIGVTQPRRVAVLATSERVAFELDLRLGKEVGFQVRHDKMIGDDCTIKFMTDGILLREVQSDFLLKRYSVIILDEAHERSLNTDILIGMLSRVIVLRKKLYMEQQAKMHSGVKVDPENMISPLKLVLMSATMRVEDFSSNPKLFHEPPPLLKVQARQYPVTIHFSKRTQEDYLGQAYKKVLSIHKRLPQGGILVFVTGQREVEFLCKKLRKASCKLSDINSKRKDNEVTAESEMDMKDINDAFEAGSSPEQQTDRFSSYDDDYDDPGMDSKSSDSESESDLEVDSEDENCVKSETPEKSGLLLDFLRVSDNLCSLKASFEALAGNSSVLCKEKASLPVAPTTEECLEPTAKSPGALYVLPLYSMLPASAQLRVFKKVPEGERLVVVATNVAETSLTIPGIKYVVDTGKVKVKNYNYTTGMAVFKVQWISQASADQRTGRAGRMGPGHCYRLYSSAAFSKDDIFAKFSCPEISKTPVDGVVLLMKSMGIDKVANFPFPTPPERQALAEAENSLKALEALDCQGRLTHLGRAMAQYPMSPRHSRMLLTVIQILRNQQGYARANFVLGYAVSTAAALSFSNPFIMQFGGNHGAAGDMDEDATHDVEKMQDQQKKQSIKKMKVIAKEVRAKLCNPSSDALTIAYALQLFELSEKPMEFCNTHSLHFKTMEDMSKLRKQLLQLVFHQSKLCPEFSWNIGSFEDVERSWRNCSGKQPLKLNEEELLGQAICAGWADRVAKRIRAVSVLSENDEKVRAGRYQSCALNDLVSLHRWSSVYQSSPEFLVYSELLQAKRPYMHGATSVKSEWLVKYASSLCHLSAPLTDPKPYYEPLSDQVFCWVSPTFGRHNWQLPLHSLPIENDTLRVSVFGCALLEGYVLPCLRSAQKFLTAPPSSILRQEAVGQKRVGDLVDRLKIGSQTIDSREKLKEAWNVDPEFLYLEIQNWFQKTFHDQFRELWKQMHFEVLKDGNNLFPKREKKSRKKGNC